MAHIVLKSVEFKNLLSYGASSCKININNGLNWIRGANGHGKSTIIEAVNFALFGSAYRDIKLASLVNNYNSKKLMVRLELDKIINGDVTTYIIYRGLKPKKFEIYRGEVKKENRIDKEGQAGIFQSYLENEILGFNEILFKHTIAMSAMSSTPFLEMSKPEKRKFVESILGVSDIEKIKKAFGSELSENKNNFLKTSSKIPERESKLEELQDLLKNAKKEKSQDIKGIESEIRDMRSEIIKLETTVVEKIKERDNKRDEGKIVSEEYDSYKNVVRDLSTAEANIKNYKQLIDKNDEKLKLSKKAIVSLSKYNDNELNALSEKRKAIQDELNDISEYKIKKGKLDYQYKSISEKISEIENILKKNAVGVPCDRCKRPYTETEYNAVKENVASDLDAHKKDKSILEKEIDLIDRKISKFDKKNEELNKLSYDIDAYRAKFLEYKTAEDTIIHCEDENRDIYKKLLIEEDQVKKLNGKVKKHDILNAKLGQLRTDFLELKHEVESYENKISMGKGSIQKLEAKINKIKNNKIDDVISVTESKIAQTKRDITSAKKLTSEYSNQIEVLKYIVNMFGDEGIKEYMIKKYIPVLNKSIDKVLKKFAVPFSISFDSTMEHEFTNSFGLAKEYKALSEGQKRRLNFSIYIAFREFVNKIGRFTINTLFLDEILDTAMDDSGLEDMIDIIKSKVNDLGAVYLISHKINSLNEEFESIHDVVFDGTFSTLKK